MTIYGRPPKMHGQLDYSVKIKRIPIIKNIPITIKKRPTEDFIDSFSLNTE